MSATSKPPLPPFTQETAAIKVRLAEDGWNGRNPQKVALAYSVDSVWRNRAEFLTGREEIEAFLTRKWATEHEYRLVKELWAMMATASQCASPMNTAMTKAIGFGLTVMRIGSLARTA